MDTDVEWVDDDDVWPELKTKILSLKVCRNRCLARASSDAPLEVATPVLKMLVSILENEGSVVAQMESEYVALLSLLTLIYDNKQ